MSDLEAAANDLADALEDMLTVAGWIPREDEEFCGADFACWKARRALHNLRDVTGRDPYCMDDRDDPPPGVAYDLKTRDPVGFALMPGGWTRRSEAPAPTEAPSETAPSPDKEKDSSAP